MALRQHSLRWWQATITCMPFNGNTAADINTDLSCGRARDSNMVLGGSMGLGIIWPQVAA